MTETFNNTEPIYLQLVQRICRQIVRGERKAGEKLPSVRETAILAQVNPNTVQRVYGELEKIQVVETRRGLGTFITENEKRLLQLREDLRHHQIASFITQMKEMGFTPEEIIVGVKLSLERSEANE